MFRGIALLTIIHMIHIIKTEKGVYNVNDKIIDTSKPLWGKHLTRMEHRCLMAVMAAIKKNNGKQDG
jgi:hypothetical protein